MKKKLILAILSTIVLASGVNAQGVFRVDDNTKFDSWKTEIISVSDSALIMGDTAFKCKIKNLKTSELLEINNFVKEKIQEEKISKVYECLASDGDGGSFIFLNDSKDKVELLIFATGIITNKPIKLRKL